MTFISHIARLLEFDLFPAEDLQEGDELPWKWIAHGSIIPLSPRAPTLTYFLLALPSYQWMRHWHSDAYRWHQLHIMRIALADGCKQFSGGYDGWRIIWRDVL